MAKQGCCTVYCSDDKLNYDWMHLHLWSMTTYLHDRDDYCLNDLFQEPRNNLRRSLRHMVASKAASDSSFPPRGIPQLMRFLLCYHPTHPAGKTSCVGYGEREYALLDEGEASWACDEKSGC